MRGYVAPWFDSVVDCCTVVTFPVMVRVYPIPHVMENMLEQILDFEGLSSKWILTCRLFDLDRLPLFEKYPVRSVYEHHQYPKNICHGVLSRHPPGNLNWGKALHSLQTPLSSIMGQVMHDQTILR